MMARLFLVFLADQFTANAIIKMWREIDQDKELCERLKLSLPEILQDVDVGGGQVNQKDHK